MPVVISMLRGINLGPHRRMKMDDLRAVYESLKLRDVRTYVQSGNVVFATSDNDLTRLTARIEKGIERAFGFHSDVIMRTADQMQQVVAGNPFAGRKGIEPAKLVVTFLAADPGDAARKLVRAMKTEPEELYIEGRELYVYFPNGQGSSKFPAAAVGKAVATTGTARNWNSVTKLLEIAKSLG
jgi:uncharacterized protein (DUF1697 family)